MLTRMDALQQANDQLQIKVVTLRQQAVSNVPAGPTGTPLVHRFGTEPRNLGRLERFLGEDAKRRDWEVVLCVRCESSFTRCNGLG